VGSLGLRKVSRDLLLARGRAATMILAIALSVSALGGVLGAYGILRREMPPSFLGTSPASATLVLSEAIDDELLALVLQRPGIGDAQTRALVVARAEVAPDRWLPLGVFVVEDFASMRIETVTPIDGAWPPPTGTLLIERTAAPVLNSATGATLNIQFKSGAQRAVQVAGIVSDPALAPAWQEQRGYAYASRETLAALGESNALDQLKISVALDPLDRAAIQTTARDLAVWLAEGGTSVEEIRIPPPGEHPHQRLMDALVLVLLLFTVLLFGLSGVVVATLIAGLLSRHVRQIGAMKAIGASSAQVAAIYALLVLLVAVLAVAILWLRGWRRFLPTFRTSRCAVLPCPGGSMPSRESSAWCFRSARPPGRSHARAR
jgi:putative ABC transport system permease protein